MRWTAALAILLCAGSTAPPKKSAQTSPPVTKRAPAGQRSPNSPPLAQGGPGGANSTTRPAASRPAVPAFEPLMDAVVGEWAFYAALDNRELRYDITHVTGALVSTRVTVFHDGQRLALPATRDDLLDFDPVARRARGTNAQRSMTPAKLKLAGRTWNAQLYEDRWTDEDVQYVRRTWVSNDAPVFGLLKMELQGDNQLEARLELKTFGRPPAKPS